MRRLARILSIDDEAQVLGMLREACKTDGYEVMDAQDGAEGMNKIKEVPVALVVGNRNFKRPFYQDEKVPKNPVKGQFVDSAV